MERVGSKGESLVGRAEFDQASPRRPTAAPALRLVS